MEEIAKLLKEVLSAPNLSKADGTIVVNMLEQFKKTKKLSNPQVNFLHVILKRSVSNSADSDFAEKFKNDVNMQNTFKLAVEYYAREGYFQNTVRSAKSCYDRSELYIPSAETFNSMTTNKYFAAYKNRYESMIPVGTLVRLTPRGFARYRMRLYNTNYNNIDFNTDSAAFSAHNTFIIVNHSKNSANHDLVCLLTRIKVEGIALAEISKKPV